MDRKLVKQRGDTTWLIERSGKMRVDGVIYASADLMAGMDDKVAEQVRNVATLPGIVKGSFAMPDAHWGYGFAIGGVAAFDPEEGVISAGGVGFDISCGVRTLRTALVADDIAHMKGDIAEALFECIPAGVGSTGKVRLQKTGLDDLLAGGAVWAVDEGYGLREDLRFTEEDGRMAGADPSQVSDHAKERQKNEMGTLGSGNHYLEVQQVLEVYDAAAAEAFGIHEGDILISIHCGSRGLGHQIGTEFLKRMVQTAPQYGLELPDRELACSPIKSPVGQSYLGAMRSGINCALANRQILTHLLREAFETLHRKADIRLLYDVSHNTCKVEEHAVDGRSKRLFVHRKGATRAWGPGHPGLPKEYRAVGQPVLIGGTMGTGSFILAGSETSEALAFSSACHGAGRNMSRREATKHWRGRDVVKSLEHKGILIRSRSMRGIAEEAPGAYKDVAAVAEATENAGLARRVARLAPLICVKG
ncbi:MAG: RtcB family protein [Phycisphaerae bacterium]|nr:RtcB family protein [Phycisphaerae bacterium]